jgi:hypothetical protein
MSWGVNRIILSILGSPMPTLVGRLVETKAFAQPGA